jgi:aspartate kinase
VAEQPIVSQKFGGTSVATAERRQHVVKHVKRVLDDGYQPAVVVSAMGRRGDPYATDTLLDLLKSEGTPIAGRDYDFVFHAGEIISAGLMSHLLKLNGIRSVALTGWQAGVMSDALYRRASINRIETDRLMRHIQQGEVPVVTGGQGVSEESDVTILGRGASDTSGVAVGAALGAERAEIYSDVPGVAITDPRIVPEARFLPEISYDKMYELARYGVKVVHESAVMVGKEGGIPILCRSTFDESPGTRIVGEADEPPLVGLPKMGPVDVVRVQAEKAPRVSTDELYDRLGVVSLTDQESNDLVLAVAPEWRPELEELLFAAEAGPATAFADQSFVSLVGDPDFLADNLSRAESLVAELGVEEGFREKTDLRITLVVPDADAPGLIRALYQALVE